MRSSIDPCSPHFPGRSVFGSGSKGIRLVRPDRLSTALALCAVPGYIPDMGWFDVHSHLTHPQLLGQIDSVLERAREAGVTSIVSNGLYPSDNQAVLELSQRFSMVRPAFGLYPVDAVLGAMREQGVEYPGEQPSCDPQEAVSWVKQHAHQAFAIGEIGLDGYWVPERFWPQQDRIFSDLVQVAREADKAVIIHTRKREKDAFTLLQQLGATRVNWHCFTGRVKLARSIAEAGHFLSIPANARRSETFTRMLQTLPRTQLLLETDCPYLPPEREGRSEPMNVAGTAQYAAEIWQCSLEAVQSQMEENYERLFGAKP